MTLFERVQRILEIKSEKTDKKTLTGKPKTHIIVLGLSKKERGNENVRMGQ